LQSKVCNGSYNKKNIFLIIIIKQLWCIALCDISDITPGGSHVSHCNMQVRCYRRGGMVLLQQNRSQLEEEEHSKNERISINFNVKLPSCLRFASRTLFFFWQSNICEYSNALTKHRDHKLFLWERDERNKMRHSVTCNVSKEKKTILKWRHGVRWLMLTIFRP
jgi:hypothetical protein